ncbi:MAG: flagellar hook-associated protein FlgK [Opitutales bacterium]|nr:flagellar hook-associated protein FlgK [Opitutales bacterium]
MSGLLGNLSSTSSAIQGHTRSIELAGKNIANINNPDYARQRLNTSSITTALGKDTVTITTREIQQLRDSFLDRQIVQESSFLSSFRARDDRLQELLGVMGETIDRVNDPSFIRDNPSDDGSLRSGINKFFNSFENFAARPTDQASRSELMRAAEDLVNSFNRASSRLDSLERSMKTEISTEVNSLNNRLDELSDLNRKIAKVELSTGANTAADLRDERQKLLEEIAEFTQIEIQEVPGSNGQISASLRDVNGDQTEILRPGFAPQKIFYNSDNNSFRTSTSSADIDLGAGKLPALQQVLGEDLDNLRGQIDTLANTIATEVNEVYYQAYVPAGTDPAVPEISFFDQPTPPPSISGQPSSVNASNIALYTGSQDPLITESIPLTQDSLRASDSSFAGSNDIALAIAGLSEQDFSALGGIKLSEFTTQTSVTLGQEIQSNANQMRVQQDVDTLIKDRRAQISGVSLDEEMANLVQFQRAFQASSRVFNVMSEMLETVVTQLR